MCAHSSRNSCVSRCNTFSAVYACVDSLPDAACAAVLNGKRKRVPYKQRNVAHILARPQSRLRT
jgi:hypothetical protein